MMGPMAVAPMPQPEIASVREPLWPRTKRAARFNPLATVGVVFITIFVCFAIFAPWIAPQDPAFIDLPSRLSPPSAHHWFGTDELGRDIFSRIR